jgi:hypothetical protein
LKLEQVGDEVERLGDARVIHARYYKASHHVSPSRSPARAARRRDRNSQLRIKNPLPCHDRQSNGSDY